jgi:ATP/maltotriose-dependent transcriptional regulator MalT
MARLGVSKKKKKPRPTELSQLKKELQRVTDQLQSCQGELESSKSELRESLEQQTAAAEVLKVIASSPTELQPVLDTVIANAVRLIGAEHGHIRQYDGEFLQVVAYCNVGAEGMTALQGDRIRPGRETAPGRAFLERKTCTYPKPRAATGRIHTSAVSGRHHPCGSHASRRRTDWDALDLAGEHRAIY